MREIKTYRDLFQASLDGYEMEYWNEYRGEWIPSNGGWYFNSRNLDREIEMNKYRIKITYPSIDWSQVSEEYRYLARDEDGQVYIHENSPKMKQRIWATVGRGVVSAAAFKSLEVGNCHWTESLVERPDNEEK